MKPTLLNMKLLRLVLSAALLFGATHQAAQAWQGVGGGGGGSGGSSGVGNSAVQNSSPSLRSGGLPCNPVVRQAAGLPTCGLMTEERDMGPQDCCPLPPVLLPPPPKCSCSGDGEGPKIGIDIRWPFGEDAAASSTCSSCGGGRVSGGSVASQRMQAQGINRYWTPFNRANNASFSPGYYSQYDSQLDFFPDDENGNVIGFFDAYSQRVYRLVDGADGDTLNGVYHDLRNNHISQLVLYTSSNATTSTVSSAATAKITYYDGFIETYQLIDLDPSTTAAFYAGRLTKRTDLDGRDLTVAYKSWTSSEISSAPNRQWQIDTVTDTYGNTQTFTYGSSQVGGMWGVTRIDRNDGAYSTYTYASNALTTVANATGTMASMSYGQDTTAQTATATISDLTMTQGRSMTYHLTNDYMTLSTSGQSQVINQPVGVSRMVVNPNSKVEWMLITPSDASSPNRFVYVGGNMANRRNIYEKAQTYDTWSYTSSGGGDLDEGSGVPIFYGVSGTLNSTVVGAVSSTTTAQLYTGKVPGYIDSRGIQYNYEYSTSGRVTKKTYTGDSTYTQYTYNSNDQITRERDRSGNVKQYVYDSNGHMTTLKVGLVEQSGSDVQSSEYAEYVKEYYPSTHTNKGMLKTEKDPLYNASYSTLHRTDYEYDSAGRLTKVTQSADTSSGSRPETTFAYNSLGLKSTETDPTGQTTSYEYDGYSRLAKTTYPDSSTEQTLYGTSGTANGKPIKTKDRMNSVTAYSYDSAGALSQRVFPAAIDANILDGQADDTTITDPNLKKIENMLYLDGNMCLLSQKTVNGSKADYIYDTYNRPTEIKTYPRSGVTLSSKKSYSSDQLFYDEDPNGRRKYYGYRASDGTLIRTLTSTVPEQTYSNFTAVWNATRDTGANAKYVIADAIRDANGQLTQVLDGRNVETRIEYDSRGREINRRAAYNTSIEARTQTLFDVVGNVSEVRTPRYFESTDTEGYQKCRETWTYNGRNLKASHTEASGTSIEATEYFTYDTHGHQATRTDFGGNVWTRVEDSCCDKQTASVDPYGHGSITNTDSLGRAVHTIQVSDVSTMTGSFGNPTDAKTLRESTMKYDALGRVSYQTTWLTARGSVDPTNPPIAGLSGVSLADGLTTQYLYDNNLADGVGLDSSAGVSVPKLGTGGSGTFNVTLASAITKLADTQTNGGAGVTFNSTSPGQASIIINAEDEISFSITDAAGRTVMSGKLNNYRGSGATALNTLASWSCTVHDSTTSLSGYGTLLVTKNIDPLGNATKTWTDSTIRTIRSLDQLDNVDAMTYDAGGNQLSVRDPNSVGVDMVYDNLGRITQWTDTYGNVTKAEYDRVGNTVKQIDAKNHNTVIVFDARNRRKSTTDRVGATTTYTYTALGHLSSLSDSESQITTYTYDSRGSKLTETYPDHTGGSPGASTYGIVTLTYDNAGRLLRKQDQLGDTCTFSHDLTGQLLSRTYRTAANSPSSTVSDTDSFTFDRAGRILTAVSGRYSNTVGYAYDPSGRKSSESLTISGQTYSTGIEYNTRNELTKYNYPDSSVAERTYHATGALNQLKLDGSTVSTRTYDNGVRLTSEVLGNGITESRSYRTDNLLSSIGYSNSNLGDLSYTWDANKSKAAESISGVMSGYGFTATGTSYDNEDRLTSYSRAATSGAAVLAQAWSLTNVGDWGSVTTNGTAQSRTHGAAHELLTAAGSSVTTDVKGNMTSIPTSLRDSSASNSLNLSWDFDNRLKSADIDANGSADVNFQYDALGRRVARIGSSGSYVFVHVDQQTITDYGVGDAPSSSLYRYVYASYIDEPVVRKGTGTSGTTLYYHRNEQYSIYAITDSNANISERYAYTAYGQPTILNASGTVISSSVIGNRITYTGREWDSTLGLYYFRARWMNSLAGRFVSRDPVRYSSGVNMTQYARSSPAVFVDPTGLFEQGPGGGGGAIPGPEIDYAFYSCWITCGWNNPWTSFVAGCQKVAGSVYSSVPSSKIVEYMNEMQNITDEANAWATFILNTLEESGSGIANNERNHSALRHCYASAKFAKLLGCACSGCIGHFREQYQYLYGNQGGLSTRRQDFNNSVGRGCAGCTGKGNLLPLTSAQGPGSRIRRTFPQGDPQIKQCCYRALLDGTLWLGPTRPPNSENVPYEGDSYYHYLHSFIE